jgi:hypothetical protein
MAKTYEEVDKNQKYFAKIKKGSKYESQISWAKAQKHIGYPFPVRLTERGPLDQYCIKGGPGGQYRVEDIDLYTERSGKFIKVRMS